MEKQSVYPHRVSRWQLLPAPAPAGDAHPPKPPEGGTCARHRQRWAPHATLSTAPRERAQELPVDAPLRVGNCTEAPCCYKTGHWTSHRFHFCPVPPVHPGPKLAQSASPESQQAAPFQPLLRRERKEKSGHDLPYVPLLYLQSPQVHGLFPAQLSKMQTPLGMLAATLLSSTTASLRSLSQAVCGNTSPLSAFSDLSHFKFSTKYICKA